jgi:hypothetical protein
MKKYYTIRINATNKVGIWYQGKIGREYEATLEAKINESGKTATAVFMVNPCQFVYPIDCEVIAERIVEPILIKGR